MGDKISQYTADGTSNPLKNADLLDSSNEDGLGGFDLSKKITALELLNYINNNVDNIYSTDGALLVNRNFSLDSKILSFIQGDLKLKSTSNDVNLDLEDSLSNKRVTLKYDSGLDSGEIILKNTAGEFFNASDGFVGVKTSIQVGAEIFNVNGFAKINQTLGLQGQIASSQGAINTSTNGKIIAIGGTTLLWQDSIDGITIQSLGVSKLNFDVGLNKKFMIMDGTAANVNSLILFGKASTSTDIINEIEIKINSDYWNGSASTIKESSIKHNITSSPSGTSQIDFSIAGTDILTLKDTGVLNAANLPTSSTGLVAGDIWNNLGILNIV